MFRVKSVLTFFCIFLCTQVAYAGFPSIFGMGKKNAASPELLAAEQDIKSAAKQLEKMNKMKDRGYEAIYAPQLYPNSLYQDLSSAPETVSFFATLCNAIYKATKNKNGENMDFTEITNLIGDDKLAEFGFTVLGTYSRWHEVSSVMLYNQVENVMLVVFSGTASKMDAYKDLLFTRFKGEENYGLVPPDYNVHNGVAQAFLDDIDDFRENYTNIASAALETGNLKVITMGHSLGGGISLLAADYLARVLNPGLEEMQANQGEAYKIRVSEVSFGAPRIYSKETAAEVENRLGKGNLIRFWSSLDPVPKIVSGTFTNSKHVGLDFFIKDSILRQTKPGIGWHSMDWYEVSALPAFTQFLSEVDQRAEVESRLYRAKVNYEKLRLP